MPSAVPRARVRVAPDPQRPRHSTALGARARANPVAARRRSISRQSSRACTRPPAFLRRLHPETSRHRTREPRDHAAPSACRITTRRRLAGGVRQTGGQRPSLRGSISASARGAISAQVPPSSPPAATRDQHDSPTTAHSTPHAHPPPSAHISLSPRVRHITAHTHPCSTHLHLHRTHHTLTSPPATRSPLPPQRPCPC